MESGCPACGESFDGEPEACPGCGLAFRGEYVEWRETARADEFAEFVGAAALDAGDEPAGPQQPSGATPIGRLLPDPRTSGLHAFFDAYLARHLAIFPESALTLGVHPHPVELRRTGREEIEDAELRREALAALDAWESAGGGTAHDRLDARVLRDEIEDGPEAGPATAAQPMFWSLAAAEQLAEVDCCDAADRARAAIAFIQSAAGRVADFAGDPGDISRSTALAIANQFEADRSSLGALAAGWRGIDDALRRRLDAAAAAAAPEFGRAAARLRDDVASHARSAPGVGAVAYRRLLRNHFGRPMSPRDAFVSALDALRGAETEIASLQRTPEPPALREPLHDLNHITELRQWMYRWVRHAPAEPGLRIARERWSHAGSHSGVYSDGGPFDPSCTGSVALDAPGGQPVYHERRHVLAHETYPGHRMEALLRRRACGVRRFADCRALVEGWAVYAVDVVHETGACSGGAWDRYVLATERAEDARNALADVLYATGAATEDRVLELLGVPSATDAGRTWLAARLASAGYALTYVLGRAEIVRLRRLVEAREGQSFDARDFHERLLAEGPIPTRWVAEAWGF